jgi:hypothetical protein
MSSSRYDVDLQMAVLEREWRDAYEASIGARADYQAVARRRGASAEILDRARERLDCAEARKAKVLVKIERLEERLLSDD